MQQKLKQLAETVQNRAIYIWGAHYLGIGLQRALERFGFKTAAFIDKNPLIRQSKLNGLNVLSPEYFLSVPPAASYVIIAATLYDEEIAHTLKECGRIDRQDFCRVGDLRRFKYSLEVADSCNLKCISCPRGNFTPQPKSSMMDMPTFEAVIQKILREDPLVWEIELYRWGEPLLNPLLPEMVEYAGRCGLGCVVSTNLNISRGLEDLIKAGPRQIIVSASGFGDSYEETHTGGRWPVFVKNLRNLADWRRKYKPEMEVEVYYHIYKNRQADYLKMRKLCDELGLPIRPTWACLLPLDQLHRLAVNEKLSPEAMKAVNMQPLPATDLIGEVKKQTLKPCGLKNLLAIGPNLEVPACSCWFDPAIEPLTRDFLQTPLAELAEARIKAELCRECEAERLHHCYLIWHEKGALSSELAVEGDGAGKPLSGGEK